MISRRCLRQDSLQLLDIRIQQEQAFLRLAQDLCDKCNRRIIELQIEKQQLLEDSDDTDANRAP